MESHQDQLLRHHKYDQPALCGHNNLPWARYVRSHRHYRTAFATRAAALVSVPVAAIVVAQTMRYSIRVVVGQPPDQPSTADYANTLLPAALLAAVMPPERSDNRTLTNMCLAHNQACNRSLIGYMYNININKSWWHFRFERVKLLIGNVKHINNRWGLHWQSVFTMIAAMKIIANRKCCIFDSTILVCYESEDKLLITSTSTQSFKRTQRVFNPVESLSFYSNSQHKHNPQTHTQLVVPVSLSPARNIT